MPYRNGNIVWNATEWTEEMISSLKDNFYIKNNKQLAVMLGLRLTVVRNKCRELGLKRMTLEYWSDEMVHYLVNNFKTKGDVEIMEFFKVHHPKQKGWKRGAIGKKRIQMYLFRTQDEIHLIASQNSSAGGRSFTIDKNSSSKNFHPSWVVQQLAWRNPEMQKELLKYPNLIEMQKNILKLNRTLKDLKK